MNKTISFWVAGIPKGQPRPKAFARKFGNKWKARCYDPGTAEEWKSRIADSAKEHIPAEPFKHGIDLSIDFNMPRPQNHFNSKGQIKSYLNFHIKKPDCDNLQKAVMDALTQLGFWIDDSQVCILSCRKFYTNSKAGAYVIIKEVSE